MFYFSYAKDGVSHYISRGCTPKVVSNWVEKFFPEQVVASGGTVVPRSELTQIFQQYLCVKKKNVSSLELEYKCESFLESLGVFYYFWEDLDSLVSDSDEVMELFCPFCSDNRHFEAMHAYACKDLKGLGFEATGAQLSAEELMMAYIIVFGKAGDDLYSFLDSARGRIESADAYNWVKPAKRPFINDKRVLHASITDTVKASLYIDPYGEDGQKAFFTLNGRGVTGGSRDGFATTKNPLDWFAIERFIPRDEWPEEMYAGVYAPETRKPDAAVLEAVRDNLK